MGRDELDYSPSSGSGDSGHKQYDAHAPAENDGRDDTHLGFNPADGDEKHQDIAETFHTLNDDDQDYHAGKRHDMATFCDQLDCTDHQKNRCLYLTVNINLREHGSPRFEIAALAIIEHVTREDGRPIHSEDDFRTLAKDLNTSLDEIRDVRTRLLPTIRDIA